VHPGRPAEANKPIVLEAKQPIGQTFGKLGTVVEPPTISITGFARHGINNAIGRGVSPVEILKTIKSPSIVLQQSGGKFLYLSNQAAVVLSAGGKVITAYPYSKFDAKILAILKNVGSE
jgi:hypothetical protein